ncbi:hypothetical protein C8255_06740 [filamentous cyanobacterium CCP3]|nr:hypothetical protein C8255_06740 [filamentous cyanobacterium CCP3]
MQSMAISDRNTLKRRFTDGKYLSQQDFATLIESTVNRRTDQFYGNWEKGRAYREKDVVIHEKQLWIRRGGDCICSEQEPNQDPTHWEVFPDDGDWTIYSDRQVMWAEVFDRVGVGVGGDSAPKEPQARLDVRKQREDAQQSLATETDPPSTLLKAAPGRWLVFPQGSTQTQTTLIHYSDAIKAVQPDQEQQKPTNIPLSSISYLINGLSTQSATWCTDASNGFRFCQGITQAQEDKVLPLRPEDGEAMLVVQPRSIPPLPPSRGTETSSTHRHLGSLGLNTAAPQAVVDLSDPARGSLLFLPNSAASPTLYLLGPDNVADVPYMSLGVTAQETSLISNATGGFGFYRGENYTAEPPLPAPSPDTVLLKVRQGEQSSRPQVGIGTDAPAARLDIDDQNVQVQVQILPEDAKGEANPAISLYQKFGETSTAELTAAIATRAEATVSGWQTSAERGFVFQQMSPATGQFTACQEEAEPPGESNLLQGRTHLAIREQGFVGIGTDNPHAQLEIIGDGGKGQFLFHVETQPQPRFSICTPNLADSTQTFALATQIAQAVLSTDTVGGFQFMAPSIPSLYGEADADDLDNGRQLVTISPEGRGRMGIGRPPRDYALDVQGTVQARAVYADTNADQVREVKPLFSTLWKLQNLSPVTFEWNADVAPGETGVPEAATSPPSERSADMSNEAGAEPDPWLDPETLPHQAEPEAAEANAAPSPDQQIGLLAHQVAEHFPQVVKTASDGSQSVAYPSLVPVLVQAINELNHKHHKDVRQLETQIEQQANRIALLAIVIGAWAAIAFLKLLF